MERKKAAIEEIKQRLKKEQKKLREEVQRGGRESLAPGDLQPRMPERGICGGEGRREQAWEAFVQVETPWAQVWGRFKMGSSSLSLTHSGGEQCPCLRWGWTAIILTVFPSLLVSAPPRIPENAGRERGGTG